MIAAAFSAWLLLMALTGIVRMRPHGPPGTAIIAWWIPSFLAQSQAFPLALVSAALAAWQWRAGITLSAGPIMAVLAACAFALAHWRNRADGKAIMAEAGLTPRLPLLAGLQAGFGSKAGTRKIADISYGPHGGANRLDLILPANMPKAPAPVLLHVHGGGWIVGKKNEQALPLLREMARRGWVCVDIDYRLGPKNRWPAMIEDTLRAVHWTKENIAQHGGDPARIFITGGSAGGHLSSLALLCHDDPAFKPGFEQADCSLAGGVHLYGRYDFLDREGLWHGNHQRMIEWETQKVLPGPPDSAPALWDAACPIARVRGDSPPVWLIHGRHDTLIPNEEAQAMARRWREAGADVKLTELSGGQHAFDIFTSAVTVGHVQAVAKWLEERAGR
ncbi:MAG: alpha/beta hydrolase [Sphingomonadaceae bacterium]